MNTEVSAEERERRIKRAKRANFTVRDKFYVVYCPKCGRENHGSAVITGACCWCGWTGDYDAA